MPYTRPKRYSYEVTVQLLSPYSRETVLRQFEDFADDKLILSRAKITKIEIREEQLDIPFL